MFEFFHLSQAFIENKSKHAIVKLYVYNKFKMHFRSFSSEQPNEWNLVEQQTVFDPQQ